MPARNRKDAAKQGKIRGFQAGDIIGVKKAGRGNTGPEWLQGTILSVAPGGFYDYEVEYVNPPAGNKFRRVCEFHCVPWSAVECDSATDYLLSKPKGKRKSTPTSRCAVDDEGSLYLRCLTTCSIACSLTVCSLTVCSPPANHRAVIAQSWIWVLLPNGEPLPAREVHSVNPGNLQRQPQRQTTTGLAQTMKEVYIYAAWTAICGV
eukprot:COSAG02_NODE_1599_length_11754_cov_6.319005_7_plen_206_part_00